MAFTFVIEHLALLDLHFCLETYLEECFQAVCFACVEDSP